MSHGRGLVGMVGNGQRSSAGRIQRALDGVYERYGTRGLVIAGVVVTITVMEPVTVLLTAASAGYLDVPFRQLMPSGIAMGGGVIVAIAVGLFASRSVLRVVFSWSGSGRSQARAPAAWRTGIVGPRVIATRVCIAMYVAVLLSLPFLMAEFDLPAWTFAPLAIGWAMLITAGGVFGMLGVEFLFRPAIRDVAAHLPSDFDATAHALPLRTKVILPIPGAVMFAVAMAGAFVDSGATYGTRLVTTQVLGLALAAVAGALFLLAAHGALDPIDQLTNATERVRDGDLSTPVPVVTADELGILAKSFNEMLEGLRDREGLREDIRASRARIVATADSERRRMERDLHDGAQQRLVLISLKLEMLARRIGDDPENAALLGELRADAARAVDELRELAHGIYPPLLESDGLAAALEDVADQAPIDAVVDSDGIRRYPPELEAAVYFCCLEALQNAVKHGGDNAHVRIALGEQDGHLQFTVTDDGRGFDPTRTNGSAGLQNMADRIGALGGTVRIDSTPGYGTTVEGRVPL